MPNRANYLESFVRENSGYSFESKIWGISLKEIFLVRILEKYKQGNCGAIVVSIILSVFAELSDKI